MSTIAPSRPVTPDGRYFVVRGRLWRCSDPRLPAADRQSFVHALMAARRAVRLTRRTGGVELVAARAAVDTAKRSLGERGTAWWMDGAPDLNRRMVGGSRATAFGIHGATAAVMLAARGALLMA